MATIDLNQTRVGQAPQLPVENGTAPSAQQMVLDIEVDELTVGDMMALDEMGSGAPGSFAAGIAVLGRFVKNRDIRTLPVKQLGAIANAVFDEINKTANAGN